MGAITPALWEVLELEHDEGNGLRIGLDDYPIHDPAHRIDLNRLILDEYLNRDIGLETVPLFIHRLRLKMRQIMPYYNKLYATEELLLGKELATFDLQTERDDASTENGSSTTTGKNRADGSSTVTSTSGARNVSSDTPGTRLSGDEDYASAAADATSTATSATKSTQDTTNEQGTTNTGAGTLKGLSKTTGFQGAASDLLTKYRQTLLNIDMMIVPDLNELFLLVRGNNTEILPMDHYPTLPMLGAY